MRALDAAQSAVRRVSFDLIYALPGDTERGWSASLDRALSLGTEHISLYQLTIEPGTRFATMVAKHEFEPLDSDASAALFEMTQARTAAAGLPAYEISNHARPGAESRHNLAYWRYQDYAGVGPGAHGRRGGMRTVRHRKPENFLSAVERHGHGLVEEAPLTRAEAAHEALVMGLRLAEGIDPAALSDRLGVEQLVDEAAVARLSKLGLLERDGLRLRTTEPGRLLLDSILAVIAV
jgi:oxygen-independent coproporphyrinogen-3 oxidase